MVAMACSSLARPATAINAYNCSIALNQTCITSASRVGHITSPLLTPELQNSLGDSTDTSGGPSSLTQNKGWGVKLQCMCKDTPETILEKVPRPAGAVGDATTAAKLETSALLYGICAEGTLAKGYPSSSPEPPRVRD